MTEKTSPPDKGNQDSRGKQPLASESGLFLSGSNRNLLVANPLGQEVALFYTGTDHEDRDNFFSAVRGMAASIFFHALLFLMAFLFLKYLWPMLSGPAAGHPQSNLLKVVDLKDLPTQELRRIQERMRTVGMKDGKEKDFTLPVFSDKPNQANKFKNKTEKSTGSNSKTPSLRDLGKMAQMQNKELVKNIRPKRLSPTTATGASGFQVERMNRDEIEESRNEANFGPPAKLSENSVGELAQSPMDEYILNKSAFNFRMSPPRGVPLDQLNTQEKIFYTFNKRTFETYVNSFLTTYRQIDNRNPSINARINKGIHRMMGKLILDENGNIITLKIVQWSTDDLVQKLFDDTLMNIRALPNPPRALLDENKEFYIYFQLNIGE